MKRRLLVISSHVIQYFAPLYRVLAKDPTLDLTVLYQSDRGLKAYRDKQFGQEIAWDIPLTDGYRYEILSEQSASLWQRLSPGKLRRLYQLISSHDAILLNTFLTPMDMAAFTFAKALKKKVLYRCESTLLFPRAKSEELIRAPVLRAIFRNIDVGLYIGKKNREYLEYYGLASNRLSFSPYSVDNDFFVSQSKELQPRQAELRKEFNLTPELPVILFSGKLIAKKQPDLLLAAFSDVRRSVPCQLLFVGDGDLRHCLEAEVQSKNIQNVHFAGFVNQGAISKAYVVADLLVLPSAIFETWGLVVNEAMCFGVPAITTDRVGSSFDLIDDGKTGRVVPYDSREKLAQAIMHFIGDHKLREAARVFTQQKIRNYSLEQAAQGIRHAIDLVSATA